jgi:hypothetical protein
MANNPVSTRGVNNTTFAPNADLVAQLTGSGQPVPGTVLATYVASGNTDITALLQYTRYVRIITATGNSTVISSFVASPGGLLFVQIDNDSGGARTITFSTGFRATGTVVGTASKAIVVAFVSDGTNWIEYARSVAAVT